MYCTTGIITAAAAAVVLLYLTDGRQKSLYFDLYIWPGTWVYGAGQAYHMAPDWRFACLLCVLTCTVLLHLPILHTCYHFLPRGPRYTAGALAWLRNYSCENGAFCGFCRIIRLCGLSCLSTFCLTSNHRHYTILLRTCICCCMLVLLAGAVCCCAVAVVLLLHAAKLLCVRHPTLSFYFQQTTPHVPKSLRYTHTLNGNIRTTMILCKVFKRLLCLCPNLSIVPTKTRKRHGASADLSLSPPK